MDYKSLNTRLMALVLGAVAALALVMFASTMFNALEPVGVAVTGGPVTTAGVSANS
ncbi:hypothetical protein [Devosia nitrariae]|uniref:Uncharacterized protein n=1 Tax=Devosia nitrariae TaxID=2071872 RepID=A0ABQ5WB03_9HYPH|nr:hypothetical protein [Devosia nitrariae]GLQ57264.1 hypothetical protein GCM10010862_45230 [Devosia nitrariae]